jgi:hypothetical protein
MKEKKNSLPIISLLIANAISLVGNMLSPIAIPWFVLQQKDSSWRNINAELEQLCYNRIFPHERT